MVLIYSVLLEVDFVVYVLYASVVLALISFVVYLRDGIRQVGNEDASND
jgi:hypothetical protein